jgi:hypothetical protein
MVIVALDPGVLAVLVGQTQAFVGGGALDGEDRVEVHGAVGLGEGLSEDLVGVVLAGNALSMVGSPRDAAGCVLLHPLGPVVVQGWAVE